MKLCDLAVGEKAKIAGYIKSPKYFLITYCNCNAFSLSINTEMILND